MKKVSPNISTPVILGTVPVDQQSQTIAELFDIDEVNLNNGIFIKNLNNTHNVIVKNNNNNNEIQLIPLDEIFIETTNTSNIFLSAPNGQQFQISILAN